MSIISTDGFEFNLPNAIDVYKFDSQDVNDPHYHGFSQMKAVDIVAEFNNEFLFIELKDYFNKKNNVPTSPKQSFQEDLKYKARDSYLFQLCHQRVDKPIVYVCVLEHLDAAMMMHLSKVLGKMIPDMTSLPKGWLKSFIKTTIVVDSSEWNTKLGKWGSVRVL